MARFTISLNGKETEIEAARLGDRLRVTYSGVTTYARIIYRDGSPSRTSSSFVLERELPDGTCQRIRAVGHVDNDSRQMWVNGRAFSYQRVSQHGRVADDDLSHSLSASIPSVVSKVLVKVSDNVNIGDKLVLLESMKMIIPIQAPCSGRVTVIHCAAGDAVQPGVQLVEISSTETEEDGE
jgi:biotin carboxyl carrier protein